MRKFHTFVWTTAPVVILAADAAAAASSWVTTTATTRTIRRPLSFDNGCPRQGRVVAGLTHGGRCGSFSSSTTTTTTRPRISPPPRAPRRRLLSLSATSTNQANHPHPLDDKDPCGLPLNTEREDNTSALGISTGQYWMEDKAKNKFLQQVQTTVNNVLKHYPTLMQQDEEEGVDAVEHILSLPPAEREAVGVARSLRDRLMNFYDKSPGQSCPRCWLHQAHCICSSCPPLEPTEPSQQEQQPTDNTSKNSCLLAGRIRRLYLLMHHKEIGLTVDTAKMILAAFPETCRLVVAGIGPEYQASMQEMIQSIQEQADSSRTCLVLFPSEDAVTVQELFHESSSVDPNGSISRNTAAEVDLIVIDGTWEQARKMYNRYIPKLGPVRVRLSDEALLPKSNNHGNAEDDTDSDLCYSQLRKHPVAWRSISTLAALRLFLQDMDPDRQSMWMSLADYQRKADAAAQTQLGPKRQRQLSQP